MFKYNINPFNAWNGSEPFSKITANILSQSENSPSQAWVSSIYYYSFRMALFLDGFEKVLVRNNGSCFKVSSGLIPSGSARKDESGHWVVTGCWNNVSGVKNADKVLVKANCEDKEQRFFLIEPGQYVVKDCWNTLGLLETRSETIDVYPATIASDLGVSAIDIGKGKSNTLIPKATKIPMTAIGGLTFLAPLSAISEEIVELIMNSDSKEGEQFISQLSVTSNICRQIAEILDGWDGSVSGTEIRLRIAKTAQELRKVSGAYLMSAGTSIWRDNNILGNRLRDIIVGTTHPALKIPV